MEVKLSNVFDRTGQAVLNALNGTGPNLIINQGGQGSSKTFSTLQVIYNLLRFSPTAIKTTLCSYALPHLKAGVCDPFDIIIESFGENIGKVKSQPNAPIYKIGKSIVNTYGIEGNIAFAHGPRRDLLFVNEVNHKVSYEVFDQLFSRSGIAIVDFNPDQSFWLHDKIIPNFPHVLIKSNFMDNPYLPKSELDKILMKKDKPGFENWWKVYGLGELGTLEGAILQNWRFEQPGEVEKAFMDFAHGFGLDYGFNPDPDALIKIAIDKRRQIIYCKELIYANNNGTGTLISEMQRHCKPHELIIAERSGRTNNDLSKYFNIKPVIKTKEVVDWLRELQNYEIVISENSFNLAKELQNYIWSDKRAGVPLDAWNHLIDAMRYYYMMNIKPQVSQKWTA